MIISTIIWQNEEKLINNIRLILSYIVKLPIDQHLHLLKNNIPLAIGMPNISELNENNEEEFKLCIKLSIQNFSNKVKDINVKIIKKNYAGDLLISCSFGVIKFELCNFDAKIN